MNGEVIRLSNNEIRIWTEDERLIHIEAVTKFGDPVELNANEARELVEALQKLIPQIE